MYEVPGGAIATLEPTGEPPDSPNATVLENRTTDPGGIRLVTTSTSSSVLYLHVTNFKGWSAESDGRRLPLRDWGGTMLAATLPPGHHVVTVEYVPSGFILGLWIAGFSGVGLIVAVLWPALRRRRSESPEHRTDRPEDLAVLG